MRKQAIALMFALFMASFAAWGGAFPDKPVEAVVPWAAGGGGDLVFRAMAVVFPKYANGHPLLIKNIPGAAGAPGIIEFMKAKPDGYTVAHWNGAQTIKTHMSETPYKATQFKGVANIVNDTFYMLVRAESEFKDLRDFVAYAKAHPDEVTFGNAGVGGGNHFAQVMFEEKVGIETIQVPFQGSGPLITGLMSGQVDVASSIIPEGANNIKSGQIRILGIFADKRHPFYPNVATAKEQGIDLVMSQYRGIVAPENTPDAVVKELENIFRQVITDPEFVKQMSDMGSNVEFLDGAAYAKTIAADDVRFKKIIMEKKLGDLYK